MEVPELDVACDPLQLSEPEPPLAVHPVAPSVAHETEVDWPTCRLKGFAAKWVIVAIAGLAVRAAVALPLPPGPGHVKVYE